MSSENLVRAAASYVQMHGEQDNDENEVMPTVMESVAIEPEEELTIKAAYSGVRDGADQGDDSGVLKPSISEFQLVMNDRLVDKEVVVRFEIFEKYEHV